MQNTQPDDAPHISKVDARSGSRSKLNRNVLAISLVLVILVMLVVVGSGFLSTDRSGADRVNAQNGAVANVSQP
ncbi:hypothetical protein [Sphingobium amiense]|uniref:hypothetical protein n=1 Tax=Sphingobium amiense TaxID=135719 RepID=UPI000837178D|nr:hypothetical protein [Sphingobium amiense]